MDEKQAQTNLSSKSTHERLLAARYYAKNATAKDLELLEHALRNENVSWIQTALSTAVARAKGGVAPKLTETSTTEELRPRVDEVEAIYAEAVQETTSLILHEIEPLIGAARVYAKKEIPDFEKSKTYKQFERLDGLFTTIGQLRQAASPAKLVEVDLGEIVKEAKEAVESEAQGHKAIVQLAGPSPFMVYADKNRLWFIITNSLRNAIESTEALGSTEGAPVVVNWNKTDKEYWLTILDHGIGLRGNLDRMFDVGTTLKKGHLGMGLAIVKQAALALGGDVTLVPRETTGAKFELRWPRYKGPK